MSTVANTASAGTWWKIGSQIALGGVLFGVIFGLVLVTLPGLFTDKPSQAFFILPWVLVVGALVGAAVGVSASLVGVLVGAIATSIGGTVPGRIGLAIGAGVGSLLVTGLGILPIVGEPFIWLPPVVGAIAIVGAAAVAWRNLKRSIATPT